MKIIHSSSFSRHGSSAVQAALDALPATGGQVVIDEPITLTEPLRPVSNTTILGASGVIVSASDGLNMIELYASQSFVTIDGVWFQGGAAAVSGFNCANITIRNCKIRGARFRGLGFGANTPNLRIERCFLDELTGCADGIFCEDSGYGVVLDSNFLNTTGIIDHGIGLHTYGAGQKMISPRVANTTVVHGGPNFAIEIGRFGAGIAVQGALVEGNRVFLVAPSNGGISLSEVDHAVVSHNIVHLNGFAPNIQGIEFAGCHFSVLLGNQVFGGPAESRAANLDSSSDCLFALNHLGGFVTMNNTNAFEGDAGLSRSQIVHNLIYVPHGSRSYPSAIYAQINHAAGEADYNMVASNTVTVPVGLVLSSGVVNQGTTQGNVVESNILTTD